MKTRIHFMDNLRTFMILLVVVLHVAIGYTSFLENIWIFNDTSKSSVMGYTVIYIDIFVMFIMFFISGYFTPQSYNKRNIYHYIFAKFRRIMIPWMIAVFILIPAYKFIFLHSRGLPQEEWFTYFHFFSRAGGNMGYFADNPTQSWLWFLPVLFVFQMAYALLARTGMLRIKISLKTAVILTFVIGLTFSLTIAIMGLNGWFTSPVLHFQRERLLSYFLFFLLGSLCYKLNVFNSVRKQPVLTISAGLTLVFSVYLFTVLSDNYFLNLLDPGRNSFIISEGADGILYYTSVYMAVFSSLYLFIKLFWLTLNRTSPLLTELAANSYQVYIIHLVVIGMVALPVLKVASPAMVKFIILVILSYAATNIFISVYRHSLQGILSRNMIAYPMLAAITLVAGIACAQSEHDNIQEKNTSGVQDQMPAISIHMAAIYGDTLAMRQHIIAGTDIDEKEPSAASTPLISASLFGKTGVVRMLIDAGADLNYQNKDGSTALHTAAFFCRHDIVDLLLVNGADREIRNGSGSTALESVLAPWEVVKGIYDYFGNTLGPLGLQLDHEYLKQNRPEIAKKLMK